MATSTRRRTRCRTGSICASVPAWKFVMKNHLPAAPLAHGAAPVLIFATTCGATADVVVEARAHAATAATATTAAMVRNGGLGVTAADANQSWSMVSCQLTTELKDQLATNPEVLIDIDRSSPRTLARQLEAGLRASIRERRLAAGTNLPSSRALAADLGVSRGVVVAAYAQLTAAGYLETRPGRATRIAAGATVAPAPTDEPGEWIPRFNFGPYVPDLSAFPREEWLRSLREALASAPDAALGYRGPRGSPSLRSTLADYLGRVRGTHA